MFYEVGQMRTSSFLEWPAQIIVYVTGHIKGMGRVHLVCGPMATGYPELLPINDYRRLFVCRQSIMKFPDECTSKIKCTRDYQITKTYICGSLFLFFQINENGNCLSNCLLTIPCKEAFLKPGLFIIA